MNKIMLVDDQHIELKILAESLHSQGYKVTATTDSAKVLQLAIDSQPDLIILDLFMPNKSGKEVCIELKTHPKTKDIAIMFMTTSENIEDARHSILLGCIDYMVKPVSRDEFLETIRKHDIILSMKEVFKPLKENATRVSAKYS